MGASTSRSPAQRGHAGLESVGLTEVVFDTAEDLKPMLAAIGLKVDSEGMVTEPRGGRVTCSSCEKPISLEDVGHVLPGSYYVYCRDPVCVLDYLERFG